MARTQGTLKLSSNIEPLAAAPLDARSKVSTLAELTASGTFPYPYAGMEVYVASEQKKFLLIGDDPTNSSNWVENGNGGGGSIKDISELPTSSIENIIYRLDNLLEYDIDYTAETISWAETDEYLQSFSDFLTENNIAHITVYRGDTNRVPTAYITNPEIFLRTENLAIKDKPLKEIGFYADSVFEYTLIFKTFDGSTLYSKDKEIFTIYKGTNNTLYAGSEKNQTIERLANYEDIPDTSKIPNTFTGTQEEWDALTENEKVEYDIANITDDNSGLEMPSEIYSTTETKTNKIWIDGKPIYRKVLTATNKGSSSFNLDGTIDNLDMVVDAFGFFKCINGSDAGLQFNVPRQDETILVNSSTGVVSVRDRNTTVNADYVILVVEYTKEG